MALISSILILGLMVIFRKYILISSALLALLRRRRGSVFCLFWVFKRRQVVKIEYQETAFAGCDRYDHGAEWDVAL